MIDYFNRNRWWAIAFVVLFVMNIATLTALWLMKEQPPRQPNGPRPEAAAFLIQELQFDSVQQQQLLQLRSEHQQGMRELRAKTRDAKDALFALLQQPAISDSILEKAVYAASESDRQMDLLTFRHFQKIRALCTPQQKPKFDAVIRDLIRLMAPPMGGEPHPPPGEGHPEGPPPPR